MYTHILYIYIYIYVHTYILEAERQKHTPQALIAQVGTGEGKSMIVAALALYVVVALGNQGFQGYGVHLSTTNCVILRQIDGFRTFVVLFLRMGAP